VPRSTLQYQEEQGWVRIGIWLFVTAILVALPWHILSHGYLPPDDALRHAAKAVSGKSWPQILVMRPDITIDTNPGWHWILARIYHLTGSNTRALVRFSVVSMFLLFTAAPLPWMRRPEAWLGALAVVLTVFPYFAFRAFLGRPLFVSMAAMLILLCVWTRAERARGGVLLLTISLMALSTWVHGSWYLPTLIPVVFLLAGAWGKALLLVACWAAGTILGASFTGDPWAFLTQSALFAFRALGAPRASLVGEFQPFTGGYPAAIIVALVCLHRKVAAKPLFTILRDPIFLMAFLGWLLGFRWFRCWLDWGLPAFTLWLGRQFAESLASATRAQTAARLLTSACAALVLLVWVGSDREARWSKYGKFECLDASRPEHAGWVPDADGILYSEQMSAFYQTFFVNPHGNWRYALGFEPSLMLPEDLAVFREIWGGGEVFAALTPWVKKMRPADRLVLHYGPRPPPPIRELEWYYAAPHNWVGRLPRRN